MNAPLKPSVVSITASAISALGLCLPGFAQSTQPTPFRRSWLEPAAHLQGVREQSLLFGLSSTGSFASSQVTGSTDLVWSFVSDDTWIAETVGLGNEGTQVITEYGFLENRVALLTGHVSEQPAAVWSDQASELNHARHVASSENIDLHVSVHQEFTDQTLNDRHAVMRVYSSASAAPLWRFDSTAPITNHTHSWADLSADGNVIALLVYDQTQGGTILSLFEPGSAVPVHEELLSTLAGFEDAKLSADGSTLLISAPLKQTVYDVENRVVAYSTFTVAQGQYGGVALSENGDVVAIGTPGDLTVLEKDAEGLYQETFVYDLPPGTFFRSPALSANGETLAVGLQSFASISSAQILAVDLTTQTIELDVVLQGGGDLQNFVQDIQCSADGRRVAVGLWGDEDNLVPELLVYSLELQDPTNPLLSEYLTGSVNDMDFSANGEWLGVASKGSHANVWGTGGAVSLYRVGLVDVSVSGVPQPGALVDIEHQVRAGSSSQVLVATALAETPIEGSTYGTGSLYLDPTTIVELPVTVSGAEHVSISPFQIAAEAEVGTTYYMQAINLTEGSLSGDWVKMTLVP